MPYEPCLILLILYTHGWFQTILQESHFVNLIVIYGQVLFKSVLLPFHICFSVEIQ